MIKVERVSKWFSPQRKAVDEVSFEVNEGETLILLGTSGCGKTTTLRMINRLLEPSEGRIFLGGKNITDGPPQALRKGIGYVLQDSGLFPHYTVAENIGIVPRLLGWDQKRIAERTRTLLEKLHLPPGDYLDALPSQLSGGQQQRVGLARALAADQPVLLMDEPFGALDPITRAHVRKDFRSLDEIRRKTVVMVTHDVSEAFELGDRICLMDKGRVAQWGTPAELLFRPGSAFVRSFFDAERFELELGVVKVKDVWDAAFSGEPASVTVPADATSTASATATGLAATTSVTATGPEGGPPLGPGTSLWQALQEAVNAPDGRVTIMHQSIHSSAILAAFQAYKIKK